MVSISTDGLFGNEEFNNAESLSDVSGADHRRFCETCGALASFLGPRVGSCKTSLVGKTKASRGDRIGQVKGNENDEAGCQPRAI